MNTTIKNKKLTAFYGDEKLADALIKQLQAHYDADEIVQGVYWENGKGCAIGCAIHSDDHAEYERIYGIPLMLAKLQDKIFELLPNEKAKIFPLDFTKACKVAIGKDLSLVGYKFLYWLISEHLKPIYATQSVEYKTAIDNCINVLQDASNGIFNAAADAAAAAVYAAYSADAVYSAADAAAAAVYSAADAAAAAVYAVYADDDAAAAVYAAAAYSADAAYCAYAADAVYADADDAAAAVYAAYSADAAYCAYAADAYSADAYSADADAAAMAEKLKELIINEGA